ARHGGGRPTDGDGLGAVVIEDGGGGDEIAGGVVLPIVLDRTIGELGGREALACGAEYVHLPRELALRMPEPSAMDNAEANEEQERISSHDTAAKTRAWCGHVGRGGIGGSGGGHRGFNPGETSPSRAVLTYHTKRWRLWLLFRAHPARCTRS